MPMHKIEQLAQVSVARGFGFGMLAILTFMVGLSGEFAIALRAGGYLCLLMCIVMLTLASRAASKPYNRTELWLMLEPAERPQPAIAQVIIGSARREALLVFALRAAWLSAGLLSLAVYWGLAPDKGAL